MFGKDMPQPLGDTSLVGAGLGSNSTRNESFLITLKLAKELVG